MQEKIILLPEVRKMLEALLIQAEQPERKRVVRIRLNTSAYDWYYSGNIRYEANEQIQMLAAKGLLRLRWQKHEQGNLLEAIDLIEQQHVIETVNALLNRVSPENLRTKLRQLLSAQQPQTDWYKAFLTWARTQLDDHKNPTPLDASDIQTSQDLLDALSAIETLSSPIFERNLSVKLFKDSKRLETLRGVILTILRTYDPESSHYEEDDWGLLQKHQIKRPPERIPLTGPLDLEMPGISQSDISNSSVHLHLEAGFSSISLPEDILRSAIITSCSAKAIITVENLTSFSELLLVRPLNIVAIHTGGFASPALILFLRSLHSYTPTIPFFHWGDIDAGGIRILAHLRKQIGYIIPVGMDKETLERGAIYAQTLTSNDNDSLTKLLTDTTVKDCTSLIDYMMENNLKLEQEAVNAQEIIMRLHYLGESS